MLWLPLLLGAIILGLPLLLGASDGCNLARNHQALPGYFS